MSDPPAEPEAAAAAVATEEPAPEAPPAEDAPAPTAVTEEPTSAEAPVPAEETAAEAEELPAAPEPAAQSAAEGSDGAVPAEGDTGAAATADGEEDENAKGEGDTEGGVTEGDTDATAPDAEGDDAAALAPATEGDAPVTEGDPGAAAPDAEGDDAAAPATATEGDADATASAAEGDGAAAPAPAAKGEAAVATEEAADAPAAEPEPEAEAEADEALADDFFYDTKPMPTVPADIMEYGFSFGYASGKVQNLFVVGKDKVFYTAGNVVVFHDLGTNEQTYLRSVSGGGIGALALHPSGDYIAVGEIGPSPDINVYEYPSMKLHRILQNGTTAGYAALAFNATGDKIASVGGNPDYMLTVWEWKKERTILRTKAFSSDVWRVSFADGDDGQLTTCGAGHIRFWRMADTFTGLKLQGDIGKFGKAEISDIYGYVELPDGKVVSGSEWGNLLLWEAGKIKCEIARKGKKPCHNGKLEVVVLDDAELVTAGHDGHIRVWNFDEIDLADAPDELNLTYEMEPLMERKVGANVHIKSMCHSEELGEDESKSIWYIQDANGMIWKADMAQSNKAKAPYSLIDFHAGGVVGIDVSPVAHVAASLGEDGAVRLYDYVGMQMLTSHVTPDTAGTCLRWAPPTVDKTGRTFYAGYADGVFREYVCTYDGGVSQIVLLKAWKPLTGAIRFIEVSPSGDIVVVGDERHLFFFDCQEKTLEPIGFYKSGKDDGDFTFLRFSAASKKLLIGRADATLIEFNNPKIGDFDTSRTYRIDPEPLAPRIYKFKSVMTKLQAQLRAVEEAKQPKKKRPKKEGEEGKDDERSEEEIAEEKAAAAAAKAEAERVYPPEAILAGWYTEHGTVILSCGGRDAGYLYECSFDQEEPSMWFKMPGDSQQELPGVLELQSPDHVMMLAGDGTMRLHQKGDVSKCKTFPVHDVLNGKITSAVESFDGAYLLSSGEDGNIFLFRTCFGEPAEPKSVRELAELPLDIVNAPDITNPAAYSIEEAKQKAEQDAKNMSADEKKAEVRREIRILRRDFDQLLKANKALPKAQQLEPASFVLDPLLAEKIQEAQNAQQTQLKAEMAWMLEKHTIAHQKLHTRFIERVVDPLFVVKSIRGKQTVSTFRLTQVSSEFKKLSNDIFFPLVKMSAWGARAKRRAAEKRKALAEEGEDSNITVDRDEPNRENNASRAQAKLDAARNKKARRQARQLEWEALNAKKPHPDHEDPDDLAELKHATDNIGDYKLKTSSDYKFKSEERVTSVSKRSQIVTLRQKIHDAKSIFNAYVKKVRDAKVAAIEDIKAARERLLRVLFELGEPLKAPPVPPLHDDERPEKAIEYDRARLDQFVIDLAREEEEAAAAALAARAAGGFGGLGADDDDDDDGEAEAEADDGEGTGAGPAVDVASDEDEDVEMETDLLNRSWSGDIWRPKVFRNMVIGHRVKLAYERDQLRKKIAGIIGTFDNKVKTLLAAKRECEVRIKFAEHQHVVYYRELVHLKSFDLQEAEVEKRLSVKKFSQQQCASQAKAKQALFTEKRAIVRQLDADGKAALLDFQLALGEGHKFEKYLTKVYKKKVKRKKPGDENQDEDSDEESSDDDDYDSDEEDDEEFDDTQAPPGCDVELFEKVLSFRERRLDAEEGTVEEKRAADMLKKETDVLLKKEKALEQAKLVEEKELADLQLAKQAKLNELDTAVPMKLDQIQHITKKAMVPTDLSASLVFSVHEIAKLKKRIGQLNEEKQLQKSAYKNIKHIQSRLNREKKELSQIVGELEAKCDELQMLKFGALVDLEALEGQGINLQAQDLRSQLRQLETKVARTVKAWDAKIFDKKMDRDAAITANTNAITDVTGLATEQSRLASALDAAQADIKEDTTLIGRMDKMEMMRLQERANMQAMEIEQLQWEISMLSQKTGTIQPPQLHKQTSNVDTLPPI